MPQIFAAMVVCLYHCTYNPYIVQHLCILRFVFLARNSNCLGCSLRISIDSRTRFVHPMLAYSLHV